VKYTPQEWTKPDAPGMYISYTYARLQSALAGESFDEASELTQSDAELLRLANQHGYALQRSIDSLDPAMLANYTYDLASKLGTAYHGEQIKGGRPGFKYALILAVTHLRLCMCQLGMFPLEKI